MLVDVAGGARFDIQTFKDSFPKQPGRLVLQGLLDIQMTVVLPGMERTQTQWKELLGSVGLEIVRFHSIGNEVEGLIEAVRRAWATVTLKARFHVLPRMTTS